MQKSRPQETHPAPKHLYGPRQITIRAEFDLIVPLSPPGRVWVLKIEFKSRPWDPFSHHARARWMHRTLPKLDEVLTLRKMDIGNLFEVGPGPTEDPDLVEYSLPIKAEAPIEKSEVRRLERKHSALMAVGIEIDSQLVALSIGRRTPIERHVVPAHSRRSIHPDGIAHPVVPALL